MNKFHLILLCLLLASCNAEPGKVDTGSNTVDLKWKIKPGETIKYSATLSEIKINQNFKLDGFEVLKNSALQIKVREALKVYKYPVGTLEVSLVGEKDGFKAKLLNIKPKYDTPTTDDELEKRNREMAEIRAGSVAILAWLDFKGRLKSFYLKRKPKNTLALFFKLPESEVTIGDKWTLPVTLIDIGEGFVPKEAIQDKQAKLVGLTKNSKGEMIAEIFYVHAEKADGQFEYANSDRVIPASLAYSYFMSGHFNVSQGRWENIIGLSYVFGSGLSQNEGMLVFMLKPLS